MAFDISFSQNNNFLLEKGETVVIKNNNSLKWLIKNLSHSALPIVLLSIICITLSYLSVRFAIISKQVLDAAVNPTLRENLRQGIIYLAILVVVQLILQIICTIIDIKAEALLRNRLRKNLFKSLLHKEYSEITDYHSGELINRLNGDVSTISSTAISILPDVLAFVSRIIFGFITY